MPKRPKDDQPEFDMDDELEELDMADADESEEEGFEVDMDVVERIAVALEAIAKVLTDREAKFASRPPRKDFGDRPQRSFGGDDRGDRGGDRGGFTKPGYGEKTFRKGPGLGYSDRDKPAGRSGDRDSKPSYSRSGGDRDGKPSYGRPGGKPPMGRPGGKPKDRY